MNKPIDGKKENKNLEEFLKYTRINEANAYYDLNLSKFSYFYVQNLKIIVVCLSVYRPACLFIKLLYLGIFVFVKKI